ncbi:Fpg/Nei family DNA glycosylase [Actinospongicola halichondriae]|uniref:Fpg/Nei family DNA glycosylase n=1 Tax=Actinospongicola halichondriae TaxID=3236844 RepID=UPI003D4575C8
MPEGHTIHRLARDLSRDLRGRPVETAYRQDRFAEGARRLDGRTLERTSANGKHLFLHWDGAEVLHIHLGLFGKFRRHAADVPAPSEALRLRLCGREAAWDLTGAITCELRDPGILDEVAQTLGPDPLRRNADVDEFVRRVRKSKKPIGALLLDQAVVAGIGNVYRAEILHLTGIHPATEGRVLSESQVREIWDETVDQLRLGVKRDRIITVPMQGRRMTSMTRENSVHVYKQSECRTCGTPVEHSDIGGRNMFACPRCQPLR